jgi:hypothetical protein
MVNTRSTLRITTELENRGIDTTGSSTYDQRVLFGRIVSLEGYWQRAMTRNVNHFYKLTTQATAPAPSHSYNLRSRKTN